MDFTQLATRYASDRINRAFKPFEDPAGYIDERFGVSEEGNVRPETDSMTQVNAPVVAPPPENQYVEQAEDLSLGVPSDQSIDGMQLAAATPNKRQRGAATAPVAPDALPGESPMDTYVRTQESGSKPDIGYHYNAGPDGKRKSTAYGAYGITAPAYRDIQMSDPYFRGRPIDSLSTTEQTRANQVYNKVQQAQLRNLGIEPTEENLRGAQLLGARGLKRYLENGTFSNEAARANGGAQNLERIVKARMSAQSAPSSQENLPPQPEAAKPAPAGDGQRMDTQGFENLQPAPDVRAGGQEDKNQQFNDVLTNSASDPSAMAQLAYNKEAPESVRRAASDQLYMLMKQQRDQQKAAAVVENAMSDPKEARRLTRELAKPSEEGSYVKAYLYQRMGMTDLAKAEQIKLGAGDHWGQSFMFDKNGQQQPVWIKYNGQGAPVKGYSADGELDERQLLTAMSTKGVSTHTGKMIDRATGKVYYEQTTPQGIRLVEAGTNQPFVGDSKTLSPYGIGSDIEMKNRIQVQELANKLRYEPTIEGQKAVARQVMEQAAKNDRGDGAEIARARELLGQQGVSIDNRGEIVIGPRPAQAAPRAEAAPGQVQPAPPAPAPAPAPATNLRQAQEGDTPAIAALRKQLRGDQKLRGESESAYQERLKREKDIEKTILDLQSRAAKIPLEVEETERKEFIKTGEEIRNAGADGSTVKGLRKQQLDILRNNPQIAGIMYGQGTQYDNARRFILDSLSGRFSGQEGGAARADELGKIALNPNEKAALAEFANLTANINQRTLKAASGPGSVSDAEQRANKEANLQYVERLEPMMVVNELFRSQFTSDLAAAKADALNRGQFKTRKEFDTYWNQESSKLTKQYAGIYKARLEMLKPYLDAVQKNPSDATALQRRRDAIMHSMNVYPAPEYNVQTGKWDYKTDNARKAAMNAVLGR